METCFENRHCYSLQRVAFGVFIGFLRDARKDLKKARRRTLARILHSAKILLDLRNREGRSSPLDADNLFRVGVVLPLYGRVWHVDDKSAFNGVQVRCVRKFSVPAAAGETSIPNRSIISRVVNLNVDEVIRHLQDGHRVLAHVLFTLELETVADRYVQKESLIHASDQSLTPVSARGYGGRRRRGGRRGGR